jgi:hypothetical protein
MWKYREHRQVSESRRKTVRDRDADNNGSLEERLYAAHNANWNVTSIINTSAAVQERYVYDPFGSPSFKDASYGARGSSSFGWLLLHRGKRRSDFSSLTSGRARDWSSILGTTTQLGWISRNYGGQLSIILSLLDAAEELPADGENKPCCGCTAWRTPWTAVDPYHSGHTWIECIYKEDGLDERFSLGFYPDLGKPRGIMTWQGCVKTPDPHAGAIDVPPPLPHPIRPIKGPPTKFWMSECDEDGLFANVIGHDGKRPPWAGQPCSKATCGWRLECLKEWGRRYEGKPWSVFPTPERGCHCRHFVRDAYVNCCFKNAPPVPLPDDKGALPSDQFKLPRATSSAR